MKSLNNYNRSVDDLIAESNRAMIQERRLVWQALAVGFLTGLVVGLWAGLISSPFHP